MPDTVASDGQPLVTAEELDALGRLRLRVRRRVSLGTVGGHRARGHGASLDFDDYRPYQPGDDPRRVDRHAQQRLGRLLVKLYEAEDETGIQVVLDASASMTFGAKAAAACRLAAALSVVAVHAGDRVRHVVADDAVQVGRWRRGRRALAPILADLGQVRRRLDDRPHTPPSGPSPADEVLMGALHRALRLSRRGPVVLISDLLQPGHQTLLRTLGTAQAGAACLHVLDPEDLDPWLDDDPRLVDVDYGTQVDGAATPAARQRFAARRDAWLTDIAAVAARAGVAYTRLVGEVDTSALLRVLGASGVAA